MIIKSFNPTKTIFLYVTQMMDNLSAMLYKLHENILIRLPKYTKIILMQYRRKAKKITSSYRFIFMLR